MWARVGKEIVPGPFDYIVWIVCWLLEASVVVCSLARGSFLRYLSVNLYMTASLSAGIARFYVFRHYGFVSPQYFYFYYYSDALLTIALFFALIGLYSRVLEELKAERLVRLASILLLAGTAWFSYAIVQQSANRLMTRFVMELSQNLYFVGLVLTYLLWAAIMKLKETRAQLIQVVLALGVYFSGFAATYALRNLIPRFDTIWGSFPPLLACLLPLAWAYAFWRIPESARLVPARLAAVHR
jgi:hypothetical protein